MTPSWIVRLSRLVSPLTAPFKRRVAPAILGALGLLAAAPAGLAQTYTFSTFAGVSSRAGSQNGTGGALGGTLFNNPIGIAVGSDGSLYITDSGNSVIRKITTTGVVSTLAGTAGQSGTNNGTATDPAITFSLPQGIAVDGSGNVFVTDYAGGTIRKITSTGTVTTLAGTGATAGNTNGTGAAAQFSRLSSLAIDGSGNLYLADSGNNQIRKITSAGVVTTVAGTDTAGLNNPRGVAVDSSGNLYIADTANNVIRKVAGSTITTLAGTAGTFGSADGVGASARFNFPNALAVDKGGNVYVADELNDTIRKITPDGTVTTFAGLAATPGRIDGAASTARFDRPTSVTIDGSGNVFVADYNNQLIRKITPAGDVSTIAGTGGLIGLQNGSGVQINPTLLRNPTSTVVDAAGNVYVADTANNSVRKITPAGVMTLVAGDGGSFGSADGTGTAARFNSPTGIARDDAGNLYVADSANQTIRRITPDGVVTLYAGIVATSGSADGAAGSATFRYPNGVALDNAGNLFVADAGNHVIRKISAAGIVSTVAGTAGEEGGADGMGTAARFNFPRDVAADSSGNIFVADTGNNTVRRISASGQVQTIAGSAGAVGSADGGGNVARFNGPIGLGLDAAGNVFVADSGNATLRKISTSGTVTTLAGVAGSVGASDGVGTGALFNYPSDVAVDAIGNLLVVDNRNHTIRFGQLAGNTGGPGGGGTGGGGSGSGSGSGSGGSGSGSTGGTGVDDIAPGAGFLASPVGITVDSSGTFYVCDTANHCIRMITSAGVVTTFAGKAGSPGTADGTGESARFNSPTGIVLDAASVFYITDTGNHAIRKMNLHGDVSIYAGAAGSSGSADGAPANARFNAPRGIVSLANGTTGTLELYIADSGNNTIRKIATDGTVSTLSGVAGQAGSADGAPGTARFNYPTGLAVDNSGSLVVADTNNSTLRSVRVTDQNGLDENNVTVVVATAGTAYTTAGSTGVKGAYDGTAGNALFNAPQGVCVDSSSGYIYVADTGNHCVRRVSQTRAVTTIAGVAGVSGKRSGSGEQALFNAPQGIFSYSSASLIICDTGNSILRSVLFPALTGSYSASVKTIALTNTATSGTTTGSTGGTTTGSSGGGGAPSFWFIAALSLMGLARRFRRQGA